MVVIRGGIEQEERGHQNDPDHRQLTVSPQEASSRPAGQNQGHRRKERVHRPRDAGPHPRDRIAAHPGKALAKKRPLSSSMTKLRARKNSGRGGRPPIVFRKRKSAPGQVRVLVRRVGEILQDHEANDSRHQEGQHAEGDPPPEGRRRLQAFNSTPHSIREDPLPAAGGAVQE